MALCVLLALNEVAQLLNVEKQMYKYKNNVELIAQNHVVPRKTAFKKCVLIR